MKSVLVCLILMPVAWLEPAYDPAPDLMVIAKSGPMGEGAAAAKVARDELAKHGVEVLPKLLLAMDTSNAVAANWYRTVYEEIVSRELKGDGTKWPIEFFKEYANDTKRVGRPRRLVLGLLDKLEPAFRASWLPTRLDDAEFRYEAVGLALTAGDRAVKDKDQAAAKTEFRKAFEAARDSTQVTQAAAKLKSVGESADVVQHLGLVTEWWLIGPFEAPAKTGFATAFEPEKKLDLQAKYRGQGGAEIVWKRHQETDTLGQLDLNKQLGTTREAVAYAYSEIDVPRAQAAQVRCGADDNCSVWLNGEKVFGRDQWLNGTRFDRFITPIKLKAGRNTLLVKVCQGPQHKDPEVPNNWSLQLRLCNEQGHGVAFRPINTEK